MSTTLTKFQDDEVERIARLSPDELTAEDARYLKRIRDTRERSLYRRHVIPEKAKA